MALPSRTDSAPWASATSPSPQARLGRACVALLGRLTAELREFDYHLAFRVIPFQGSLKRPNARLAEARQQAAQATREAASQFAAIDRSDLSARLSMQDSDAIGPAVLRAPRERPCRRDAEQHDELLGRLVRRLDYRQGVARPIKSQQFQDSCLQSVATS